MIYYSVKKKIIKIVKKNIYSYLIYVIERGYKKYIYIYIKI